MTDGSPRRRAWRATLACTALVTLAVPGLALHANAATGSRTVTYDVASRGRVTSDLAQFAASAAATYADARGWALSGSQTFRRVSSGGQFHLILAAPDVVGSFAGCSAAYSCRSGSRVLINERRWVAPPPSWTLSASEYRSYVVNHETGHWLGLGHLQCAGRDQPAPVMQQQSKSLQGCRAQVWPAAAERQRVASLHGLTVRTAPPVRPAPIAVPTVPAHTQPVLGPSRRRLGVRHLRARSGI